MRRTLSALLCTAALLGAAAAAHLLSPAGPADAAFPGANGKLAVQGYGKEGIFTTGPNGHGPVHRLTHGKSNQQAWSPNGHRIAFVRFRGDRQELYKMKANGNKKVPLTRGGGQGSYPAWAPSGKKIAYVRTSPGYGTIFKMRSNGANKRRVTPEQGVDAWSPAWSPDGRRIAYVCDSVHRGTGICAIAPDGTHFQMLTDTPRQSKTHPDWSPDGDRIVFSAGRGGDQDIYVMEADGGHVRRLTAKHGDEDIWPVWSPDGTKIAFVRLGSGIWMMRADGSHERKVIANASAPAWQPK